MSINWGDGSGLQTLNLAAGVTAIPSTAHTYLDDNPSGTASDPYTITVAVTDDDTGLAINTTIVTVNNVAPSAIVLNLSATTINEGQSTALSGSFTDPGTLDPHTVSINWGDGSAVQVLNLAAGVTAIPSTAHTYLDDNPPGTSSDIYTITVTVADDDTGTANNTTTVTVNNVAPSAIILSRTPTTINEGQSTALSGSFTDPGTLDPHTVTINWGDGSAPQVLNLAAGVTLIPSTPHIYLDDNPVGTPSDVYTITVFVADDDGGFSPTPAHWFMGENNTNNSGTPGGPAGTNVGVGFAAGQVGQAFSFPGNGLIPSTDPSISYPAATFAPGTADFSIAFRMRTSWASGGNMVVMGNRTASSNGNFLSIRMSGGRINVELDNNGVNFVGLTSGTVNDGAFHAVVVSRSAIDTKLYVDGALVDSVTSSPTNVSNANAFKLGAEAGSAATFTIPFNGILDEVQMFNAALSAAQTTTVTVNNVNPTATFTNGGPYVFGQPRQVTFSNQADPSASDLAGLRYSYDFNNDGIFEIGNGTYAGSVVSASAVVPPPGPPGNYTIRGRVIDDDTGFTDYTTVITVIKANTTTTVTAAPASPSIFGQSVTFTATVAVVLPGAGTPTGTVSFNIDGNIYCANTPLTGLTATCTQAGLPALAAGVRNVVAIYNGDTNFNGSAGTLNYTVNKANTTTAIITDLPDPSLVNQPYTVTWTVTAVAPGAGTPTGTVTVNGGAGGGSCTAAVAAGSCQLTPTTIGVKTIQATYNGDANFNTSASSTTTHTVNVGIGGTVRNGITNAPIVGEPMILSCASPASIPETTTNAAGQYSFAGQFVGPCAVFPTSVFSEPFQRNYATVLANITNADFLIYANASEFPRKLTHQTQYVTPGAAGTMPVILNSLDNEVSLGYSITYDINPFAQPPVFVCGANAPGCTITNNTSVFGKVGVTIVPAGGVFTRPDGSPLEAPEVAGPKEIARINFQTAVTTTLPSTDFTIGGSPTAVRTKDAANNDLLTIFVLPARVVFAQGIEGDVAGRNAGSGMLEAGDVVQTRRFITGLDIPVGTHNEFQRTDTSPASTKGNGILDATDLVQTRRYVANLDAPQSAGGSGVPMPSARIAPPSTVASEIEIGDAQATNSTRISVPVGMKASGTEVAMSFTVRYDETRLGEPNVTLANDAPEGAVLTVGKSEPGYIRILIDSTRAFAATKDARLIDISFDVLERAPSGNTTIAIEDLVFSDANATATRSRATNGNISIAGPIPADDTDTTLTRTRRPSVDLIEEWLDNDLVILRPREIGETQRPITRTRMPR